MEAARASALSAEIDVVALARYLMRAISLDALKKATGLDKSKLDVYVNQGYIIKNVKLWIYWCYVNGGQRTDAVRKEFGIRDEDRKLAERVLKDPQLRTRLAKCDAPALTLHQFDQIIMAMLEETRAWRGRMVNAKLKFLMRSYGKKFDDLNGEIEEHSIRAVMLTFPALSSQVHLVNYAKRAMHNYMVNLIDYHTRQKRNALQRTSDGGFETVAVSSDALAVSGQEIGAWDPDNSDFRRLLEQASSDQLKLLHVLADEGEADFVDWLRLTNQVRVWTSSNFRERVSIWATYCGMELPERREMHEFVTRLVQCKTENVNTR